MMRKTDKNFGYARREGFTVVSLPYAGNDLQFVVLLPDDINGLRELESKLSADVLAGCAKLEKRDVDLYLPKFKLEPPTITLAKQFEALGMKTAFDQPKGSANFDKIAPRTAGRLPLHLADFPQNVYRGGRKRNRSSRRDRRGDDGSHGFAITSPAADRSESRSPVCLRYSARAERRLSISRACNRSSLKWISQLWQI